MSVDDPLARYFYEQECVNAYVSYYKENEMQPGDNSPVGILLCTRKGSMDAESFNKKS